MLDLNHLLEENTVVTMVTVSRDTRNTVMCRAEAQEEEWVVQPKGCWFDPWLLLAMWSLGASEQTPPRPAELASVWSGSRWRRGGRERTSG